MQKQTQITIIPVDLCRFKLKIKPYLFIVYTYKLTMILIVCIKLKKSTYCISLAVEVFCYPGWSLSCDDSDINTDDIDDDDVKDADNLIGIKTRKPFLGFFWSTQLVSYVCLNCHIFLKHWMFLVPKPSLNLLT